MEWWRAAQAVRTLLAHSEQTERAFEIFVALQGHLLTDYGTDEVGEAALLAFTYAQLPGRANRLLVLGAALRGTTEIGLGFARSLLQAWRRGRRAVWLPALPYEELLAEPLDAVRALARIDPAGRASGRHPARAVEDALTRLTRRM